MPAKPLIVISALLLLLIVYVYFPKGRARQGGEKYPVTGTVLVNGEPAWGVQIQLVSSEGGLSDQDARPGGTTDKNGNFELTSYWTGDGAVSGEFAVVFFWPTNILNPSTDRFRGKFLNASKSTFRITIPPEKTKLTPFDLIIDSKELLPLEFGMEHLERQAAEAAASP